MTYLSFDLRIGLADNGGYRIRAGSERQGEATGSLSLITTERSLKRSLSRLARGQANQDFLRRFGTFLYEQIFSGDVEALFHTSLGDAGGSNGLRIRFMIEPPEISVLPWEYLYSPRSRNFIGASRRTPLVRYLEVFQPVRAVATRFPVKVLLVIPGGSGLDVSAEKKILMSAMEELGENVIVQPLEGKVTLEAVSDALLAEKYHVFHFIGHGMFRRDRGFLRFNAHDGDDDWIPEEAFASYFLDDPSLKLIVLNACQGARSSTSRSLAGTAAALVARGIPAVVAHQYSISDQAAIRFCREFYRSLCCSAEAGRVDTAMAHARNQLSIHFPSDHWLGAPVLFMRSPDGVIFDVHRPASPDPNEPVLSAEDRRHREGMLATHLHTRDSLEERMRSLGPFVPQAMYNELDAEMAAIQQLRKELGDE